MPWGEKMVIHGFQKMTVLDFPGLVACTVFTAGCNLRCPFCHNARLVTHIEESDSISEEEVLSYLEKRHPLLDGVCVTGGEPLLQPDISEFLEKIKALGLRIKLDTNGCFPEKLKELVAARLVDFVAMDIKNSQKLYAETVGIRNFDISAVKMSVEYLKSGAVPYEFRTTVVNGLHTEQSMREIGEWLTGANRYYLQGFVDSGDLIGGGFSPCSREFMDKLQDSVSGFVENVELRGV